MTTTAAAHPLGAMPDHRPPVGLRGTAWLRGLPKVRPENASPEVLAAWDTKITAAWDAWGAAIDKRQAHERAKKEDV